MGTLYKGVAILYLTFNGPSLLVEANLECPSLYCLHLSTKLPPIFGSNVFNTDGRNVIRMRASGGVLSSRLHSNNEKGQVPLNSEMRESADENAISQFQNGGELFSNIVGYEDIKKLFQLSLFSKERPVHILLVGPPASAKTLFMLECMKLERSYFTLGSHSTKSGMIEYLFEKRPRYLIIDEIEHMPVKDQTALLSLMETGIIAETKFQKARNTQLRTWVFATSNATERMLTPLLSRFLVLYFKPYKYGSFKEVTIHLLCHGEGIAEEIAGEVADVVWTKLKSRDIRDCVKIANLAKTREDVKWVAETMRNYSHKPK